jgi:hypothetical protein
VATKTVNKSAGISNAAKENAEDTKKFNALTASDFKVGASYHIADGDGNINPVAYEPKGTLSQQAIKFQDAILRGGAFAPKVAPKPAAKSKKKIANKVSHAKDRTKTAFGENKNPELTGSGLQGTQTDADKLKGKQE